MAPFGEHPLNMFSYRIMSYDNIYKQDFNKSFVFRKLSYTHEGHKFYGMSRDMRFPTMWFVQPAKAQTILCVRAD